MVGAGRDSPDSMASLLSTRVESDAKTHKILIKELPSGQVSATGTTRQRTKGKRFLRVSGHWAAFLLFYFGLPAQHKIRLQKKAIVGGEGWNRT